MARTWRGTLRGALRGALTKWSVAVALAAVLALGGLLGGGRAPTAQARFFSGCVFLTVASASSSGSGYTLQASLRGKFDVETGSFCGPIFALAVITEPANGAGGTLSATLFFDTNSVTSSTTTAGGGASGATFSISTPTQTATCGSASAAFTSTSVSLTATTTTVCPT